MTIRLLHFADAHIDMANYGRHDPATGLPVRVLDFLKSLDVIIDTAINEKVDLVIFAGDAYKDRSPAPTYQREWGKRIIRLSQAKIPTILLVGNHDLSPAIGRAHAIQEFETLEVPYIHVISQPSFFSAETLGIPVQVLGMPWVSRSGLMAALETENKSSGEAYAQVEERLGELLQGWLKEKADPTLPTILTAHASVQGATYGQERQVMLGGDLVLTGGLVKDPRLDYVALGHIHKPQNLNEGQHPPVIYPGSIERVDFGEAADEKFFILAEIQKGKTNVTWRKLEGIRPFVDRRVVLTSPEKVTETLINALPSQNKMRDAIVRLVVEYPREFEKSLDEQTLRMHTADAFEFHFVKRPQIESRVRLPQDQTIASYSPLELIEIYWNATKTELDDPEAMHNLASQIVADVNGLGEEEAL